MNTERLLQIHLVVLCLLGAVFVALSTENGFVPIAVIAAGILAILFTDAWKWFRLHRVPANIVAIGAVVFSLRDFFGNQHEAQLLAIANLLVYLQLILFFQEKNDRIYWQIILLSLLQVVVGAALNLGIAFGGLLLVYTIVSLTALLLFFLHRETAAMLISPENLANRRVRKRIGGPPLVLGATQREEYQRSQLTPRLVGQCALIITGTVLFSAVYFLTSPRHLGANWSGSRGTHQPQTGFSREFQLQQMGKLLQDNSLVMRVWLENADHKPLLRFEPYFCGEVLRHYDANNHGWQISGIFPELAFLNDKKPIPAPPGSYYQHVRLEPTSLDALFTISPAFAAPNTPAEISMDPASRLLSRRVVADPPATYNFTVQTTGLTGNSQPTITPCRYDLAENLRDKELLRNELSECKHNFPRELFPGLARTAQEWLETHRATNGDPLLIARTLEGHFQQSGIYTYSLNMNIERDLSLDPIEDFVTKHRTGHCQYFASALIMMLRSQKIPARMAIGYRGQEYNEVGGFYQVRQRHAHAWVEAYVEQAAVPIYEPTGGPLNSTGAWVRLDPTPSGEGSEATLARTWLGIARDWLDDLEIKWSDYVVDPNQSRQNLKLPGNWQSEYVTKMFPHVSWRSVAAWLGVHFPEGTNNFRFDWWASLSAMGFTILLIGVSRFCRWLWRRWDWPQAWRWSGARRRNPTVQFYVRLEKLLTRLGYERRVEQTPREYSEHCGLLVDEATRLDIRTIVEAFYAVRFGARTLTPAELSTIEQSLATLERQVRVAEVGNG